ncbi:sugar transferase [Frigidibacter oleivorans]|uniref:sugar transferase n=1 Tax=Frigidibacter oleivorans TaxID=2487129 RepID=UPI000F8DA581|nr:sugar transferase [Frigidibacter oleivorans]
MKDFAVPETFERIEIESRGRPRYLDLPKRAFDLVLAVFLAPVIAPVIAVLWVLVRLDGGPGFFGHVRVGRGGRMFHCWKIRTMVPDAEARLREHLLADPEAAAEWARDFKLARDPRITRIGGFLRKTSLDELPQFWNVIRGDMSFVGPRPVISEEMERYGKHRDAYCAVRPGVTGLWQVSGRNDVSYAERVALDVRYLQTASLLADLRIILQTAGAVLNRTGK